MPVEDAAIPLGATQDEHTAADQSTTIDPGLADPPSATPAGEEATAHTPGPATVAARMAAQRDVIPKDERPHRERLTELWRAPDAATGTVAPPPPVPEVPLVEIAPTEPELAAPQEAPEPRRGFFARLFGRGRKRSEPAPTPVLPSPPVADRPPIDDDALDLASPAGEAGELPAAEMAPASGPETPSAPLAGPAALELELEPASGGVAPDPAPLEHPPSSEEIARDPEAFATAAETVEPSPAPSEPAAEQPQPVLDSTPTPASEPAEADPAGTGLAAELAAAEEVAAEQVEAVLTGVLDRLGAAHHRPFSRS